MFVVLFEVQPKTDQFEQYLELAKLLRPELEQIEGFLDNERYRSVRRPQRILSLSSWRDEKALIRWRIQAVHHGVQEKGRFLVFLNYRLRVGEVSYNSPPSAGPVPQSRFDETGSDHAKAVSISEFVAEHISPELPADHPGLVESELFESIYTPGKFLQLNGWSDKEAMLEERNTSLARYREVRVIRSYGMFDRAETPQYYRVVEATPEALKW